MECKDECVKIFAILHISSFCLGHWKNEYVLGNAELLQRSPRVSELPNLLVILKALKRKAKHLAIKANYYVPFVLNNRSNEKILFQTYKQFFSKVKFKKYSTTEAFTCW